MKTPSVFTEKFGAAFFLVGVGAKAKVVDAKYIHTVILILYPILTFLAFRAYLLEPPPQDYITKGKTIKNFIHTLEPG